MVGATIEIHRPRRTNEPIRAGWASSAIEVSVAAVPLMPASAM